MRNKSKKIREHIIVDQTQIGEISSPGLISSGGLGPCIAIAIYDSARKQGYMMHESNAHVNNKLPDFLDLVLTKSKIENLIVRVAGGEIDANEDPNSEENLYTKEARDYVKEELEKRFASNQIKLQWNNSFDAVELFLDTRNGHFYVELTSFNN